MDYIVKKADISTHRTGCLVVPVFSNSHAGNQLVDEASHDLVKALLRKGDLKTAQSGQTLLSYDTGPLAAERILLLACGDKKDFSSKVFSNAVSCAVKQLDESNTIDATFVLPEFIDADNAYDLVRSLVNAAENSLYRFDDCKSESKPNKRPLKKITLLLTDGKLKSRFVQAVAHGKAIANGQTRAKNLANLPGNICTPTYLADQAREIKRGIRKMKVSVLEEKDMHKLGMGALLSVSRGSRQPAKLIVMEYKGTSARTKPIVLVGKGLTFDAGGISIKPAANMDEMKYDMCGGASVLGTLQACAELDLAINVIGIVPSSENLPDGDANKPGDIVTSMSGQTIEILNTDAEGRLILCDALTYCGQFDPDVVIDIATLTGACVVALGKHASGLMSNNDVLADDLTEAGQQSNDRVWRLPIWDDYQQQLDSNFADMANIGGPAAGTITAACFLSRFTKKYKWAHLDIAGSAWISGGKEKGATGRPVSLLVQYLLKRAKQVNK
jgi:leucyl aminopeptidase